MLTQLQKQQLANRGVSQEKLDAQISNFINGFPYLKIVAAATPKEGIKVLGKEQADHSISIADKYKGDLCKFVPASGAATRMFKDLFEAVTLLKDGGELKDGTPAKKFVDNILRFPFFDSKNILNLTLFNNALNYGAKPKGLIEFHKYDNENRTPFEEHLVEGAKYAKDCNGNVRMVVTVSAEHMNGFTTLLESVRAKYESRYNCKYDIKFTTQSPSTDIVAVDMNNNAFVKDDGELLFRPGGHGALLDNLNAIDSNVIVIKNIDNVVKESLLSETITWKKVLIGRVIELQNKVFEYLNVLDKHKDNIDLCTLEEIKLFMQNEFCIKLPNLSKAELYNMLYLKLNRPIRVCGMVKNEGEPGGGPYVILNEDGTTSLQILEAAQIDTNNPDSINAMKNATHFNPVDLVCAVGTYKGGKFNLNEYSDSSTGFISEKSFQGRALKAQELPGLWNGAMSNWNTQFVETPLITFNPVKTVLDLLREQHCSIK